MEIRPQDSQAAVVADSIEGWTQADAGCPLVARNESRCGGRFNLGHLEQAFCVCFGLFHGCAVFHRINGEMQNSLARAAVVLPFIDLTIHVDHRRQPLRATGT